MSSSADSMDRGVHLSKVIEELRIILAFCACLFQQFCCLRVVPTPIVENAKGFGDVGSVS
jgi:hypothetical protein